MRQVAVVTGGASGMGRSICMRLAHEGDAVTVVDWDGAGAERVALEIQAAGGRAVAQKTDVSDREQVDAAMETARREFGPVGVLVTSAGVSEFTPFTEISIDNWERIIAVNLTGTFHCVQSAIPDMIAAHWGRIVLISSSSAQRGGVRMAHYASSKGGVIAMTKTLALEFAQTGITVNNIAPSAIETPMNEKQRAAGYIGSVEQMATRVPVGRLGTGEDIAAACSYLCSSEASFITGQTVSVNGGSFVGW